MKKLVVLFSAFILSVFIFSCSAGPAGPEGEAGTASGGLVMHFQNSLYPTGSYLGVVDARIWNNHPDTNYGSTLQSEVGSYSDVSKKRFCITNRQ